MLIAHCSLLIASAGLDKTSRGGVRLDLREELPDLVDRRGQGGDRNMKDNIGGGPGPKQLPLRLEPGGTGDHVNFFTLIYILKLQNIVLYWLYTSL